MRYSEESLKLIIEALTKAGIDPQAVLQRLAESGHLLAFDGRFDHKMHVAFWEVMEELTGDPDIGLHLCPHLPVYRGRVFEYLFLSSSNYAAGLRTAFKYQRLVSDAFQAELVEDDDGPRVVMAGSSGDDPVLRHTEICTVYSWLQAMDVVTDGRFVPTRLCLWGEARAPQEEYEQVFGCPVGFGDGANEIWVSPELLRSRSPHRDPELLQLHTKYADNQLSRLARQDLTDDVYEHVKRRLQAGSRDRTAATLTLSEVAEEFGMSARHLRFVLSETGTSFRQIRVEAQFSLASRLLSEGRVPVEDIAFQVGFSEPSTFHRAFKKWSGMTPKQFRDHELGSG